MLCLHLVLALISIIYGNSYSAQQEKTLYLHRCKFEWIENQQQPPTFMLQFFGNLHNTDDGFFLTLFDSKKYCNYPLSKQEFDLLLMQYVGLGSQSLLCAYGTLNGQSISISMARPIYQMRSSLEKDHTKASIGLHLKQISHSPQMTTYTMTIKKNFELPLFAQNETYYITTTTKDTHHNLTTKREDFLTHYLCFNFMFLCEDESQKDFLIKCYVSTVRTLDKKVIISDPYFYIAKEKILLLLQAVQHIESSVESNDNA